MTAQAVSLAAIEGQSLAVGCARLRAGGGYRHGSTDHERQYQRPQQSRHWRENFGQGAVPAMVGPQYNRSKYKRYWLRIGVAAPSCGAGNR
jgi:hypothetical protein